MAQQYHPQALPDANSPLAKLISFIHSFNAIFIELEYFCQKWLWPSPSMV